MSSTLTVAELISQLRDIPDQDLPVYFSYDYGDHSHTTVCGEIEIVEDQAKIKYSDYHRMHSLIEDGESEGTAAVVIR